jgi:Conserved hypothetical protein 2217 (DUF2460)
MALPVFPLNPLTSGIAYPLPRKTIWSTVKNDALTNKRVRTTYMTYPIYGWELIFADTGFLRQGTIMQVAYSEWAALQGFINQMAGGVGLFLYSDPNDNVAAAGLLGTGDGVTMTFQMTRGLGGFNEPVYFPNVITDIQINGVTQAGSSYVVGNYGQVTFNVAPPVGAAITWDGTFYWGCRFDEDETPFANVMLNLWELKSLKFSSEKLP